MSMNLNYLELELYLKLIIYRALIFHIEQRCPFWERVLIVFKTFLRFLLDFSNFRYNGILVLSWFVCFFSSSIRFLIF